MRSSKLTNEKGNDLSGKGSVTPAKRDQAKAVQSQSKEVREIASREKAKTAHSRSKAISVWVEIRKARVPLLREQRSGS
jgi:hypothetical protein